SESGQLTVTRVVGNGLNTSNPTVAIDGNNFGKPSVYMGASGGNLIPLTVLYSSNNFISGQLSSATSSPGSYLLVVSRGVLPTEMFSVGVTFGVSTDSDRSAGPTGPTGPTGPAGPTGATGAAGSANINGTANFLTKFTSATTGGNSMIYDDGTKLG